MQYIVSKAMPNVEKIKERKSNLTKQAVKKDTKPPTAEDPEFDEVINNALLHVDEYKEKRKAILTHSPSKPRVVVAQEDPEL